MAPIRKVLIANRGEIAVRIARACKDSGIRSVAVYADPDRDALHVKVADEAYALGGSTPGDSYLVQEKLLAVAVKAGADAVHPGYGFLAENASFAQAVLDAGLIWIGPPPEAIHALGDKVKARHIATKANAHMVPGTSDPVKGSEEVVAFAKKYGLPVAIKAVFGGGGRGMKVARTMEQIPELFDSATREAVAAFGRGECFVERYLDKPRHVETQCLADDHGNVVVVSTRDCSLQRRHQKLVEEAPAPFLSRQQNAEMVRASKAILKEAGYRGAGTCEFLVGQDGVISFLEVNTRLQVEHPVTEEVTGIDLVREQFRIASGEAIGYPDPAPTRHSIEFRINGEDRTQALARARRALAEFVIDGMPTVLPFHRAVVADEAFAPKNPTQPFTVHTRWIETEFVNEIPAYAGVVALAPEDVSERQSVVVEVGGKRLEVVLPGGLSFGGAGSAAKKKAPKRSRGTKAGAVTSGDSLTAPMQGTIVKIAVENGQMVQAGDLVVVLEAMKMEQPINAHKAGTITNLSASVGETVTNGAVVAEIKD